MWGPCPPTISSFHHFPSSLMIWGCSQHKNYLDRRKFFLSTFENWKLFVSGKVVNLWSLWRNMSASFFLEEMFFYFLARWSIGGVDGGTWTLPSSCRPTPAAGRMRPKLLPRLPGQLPRMCCRSASSNEPPKVPPQLKAVSEWSLLTLESQNKEGWITKDSFKRCACLKKVPTKAPLTKKKLICGSKETNIFLFWDYIDIWKMARCSCWQGFRKFNWNSKQRHKHAQRRLLKGNEGRIPFAATRHNMYFSKYFLNICQIPKDRYKH